MQLMTVGQIDVRDGRIRAGDFFLNSPPTGLVHGHAHCWICRIDPATGFEDTQIVVHAPYNDPANEAKAQALAEQIVRGLNGVDGQ
jgi:hypothetical protein